MWQKKVSKSSKVSQAHSELPAWFTLFVSFSSPKEWTFSTFQPSTVICACVCIAAQRLRLQDDAATSGCIRAFLTNLLSVDPVREMWNFKLACIVSWLVAFRNSPNNFCLFWEQTSPWPASEPMLVFLVSDPEQSSVLSCYEQLSRALELIVAFETQNHSSGTKTSDSSDNPVADIREVLWTLVKSELSVHNLLFLRGILKRSQNAVAASGRALRLSFVVEMQHFIIIFKPTFTSLTFSSRLLLNCLYLSAQIFFMSYLFILCRKVFQDMNFCLFVVVVVFLLSYSFSSHRRFRVMQIISKKLWQKWVW